MYYEVKLKVMKTNKDGLEKEVKEHFITDCSLFAEAEAKGLEQYASDNMESDVFSISRSNIIEIINEKTEDKPCERCCSIKVFASFKSFAQTKL